MVLVSGYNVYYQFGLRELLTLINYDYLRGIFFQESNTTHSVPIGTFPAEIWAFVALGFLQIFICKV